MPNFHPPRSIAISPKAEDCCHIDFDTLGAIQELPAEHLEAWTDLRAGEILASMNKTPLPNRSFIFAVPKDICEIEDNSNHLTLKLPSPLAGLANQIRESLPDHLGIYLEENEMPDSVALVAIPTVSASQENQKPMNIVPPKNVCPSGKHWKSPD